MNVLKKLVVMGMVVFCSFSAGSLVRADYQITVEATAYNAYEGDGIAADGTQAVPYGTIAVDPSVIPLGSQVYVPGFGWLRANDTGGAIQGNIIDIAMGDDESCYSFGRQVLTVTVAE